MQILFSVGSGGVTDYQNIGTLLSAGGGVPGQPLYDNFLALKKAMVAGGGDIDAIDFDNEEIYSARSARSVQVDHGRLRHHAGQDRLCQRDVLSV